MAEPTPYTTKAGRRWRVRYRTPSGKQTDKRGFLTKKEAQLWAADNIITINNGTWIDPKHATRTVGELGDAWLARQTHQKRSARRRIDSTWTHHVKPAWEHTPIGAIRPTHVQAWLSGLKKIPRKPGAEPTEPLGPTGVLYAHQVLSSILADAVRDRMLATNPCEGMKLPKKTRKRKVYLTHEQLHRFADEVRESPIDPDKRATLVLVLGYCGPRWGEATGIKVRDFNALRRRFSIVDNAVEVDGEIQEGSTKGNEPRTIPIPRFLVDQIAALCVGKGPADLIFDGVDGGHLPLPPYERGWWQQAVRRAGIPRVTPHDLRHTAASLAVSAGANVKALQMMLGHKRAAETLDIYADLFDDDLDGVADRLDEAVGRMWAQQSK